MISRLFARRSSPIGIDIGSHSVRLVQLNNDRTKLIDAIRTDIMPASTDGDAKEATARIAAALRRAREGGDFQGREAIVSLSDHQLFVQNLRVAKGDPAAVQKQVQQEAAGRIPFPAAEAELRFVEAADVRQADTVVREVILMACHRPRLHILLETIEASGLTPIAVDVEPMALVRSYVGQFRRDDDRKQRAIFAHVGYERTAVVIAQGEDLLFVKYLDLGGRDLDQAVAKHLDMSLSDATALRRNNGDRRSEGQDPEIACSVAEAIRPTLERLAAELSMCVRYHSVTFRGQPLVRLVLGGGESNSQMMEWIGKRLDLKCELSDSLRHYAAKHLSGRRGQWDVATGLALRPT